MKKYLTMLLLSTVLSQAAVPVMQSSALYMSDENGVIKWQSSSNLSKASFPFTKPFNVIFEGDSQTASNFAYPFWLTNNFNANWKAASFITNAALSGATLADIDNRWTNNIVPFLSSTQTVLFIWSGHNDYWITTSTAYITVFSNYLYRAKQANCINVVLSTLPRNAYQNSLSGLYNPVSEKTRDQYNNFVRTSSLVDYLVDADMLFPDASTNFYFDGTHLTTNANNILSFYVQKQLSNGRFIGKTSYPTSMSEWSRYTKSRYLDTNTIGNVVTLTNESSDGWLHQLNIKGNSAINGIRLYNPNGNFWLIGSENELTDNPFTLTYNNGSYQRDIIKFNTNGGAIFSGPLLSTSSTTNSPANTELATAGFVRNLISGSGVFFYNSTNITSLTNVDAATPVYAYITNIPYPNVRSYSGMTNGQYVGSVSTTNMFQQVQGPLTINSYMNISANSLSLKPEIYYSHDGTNWIGDYEAESKAIATGTTNLYSWVINVPTIIATNVAGFYIERRFKVTAIVGNPTLNIWVGTNTPSNISFDGPNTASGQAFLAASQTFTGVNNFTQPLAGSNVQAVAYGEQYFTPKDFDGVNLQNVLAFGARASLCAAGSSPGYFFTIHPTNLLYGSNVDCSFQFLTTNAPTIGPVRLRVYVTRTDMLHIASGPDYLNSTTFTGDTNMPTASGTNLFWLNVTGTWNKYNVNPTNALLSIGWTISSAIPATTNYYMTAAKFKFHN